MARIVFGSPEAAAVLEKDRPLREAAAKAAAIEDARFTGRIEIYEVFIEEDPPPCRSVIVKAYSEEEAEEIVEKDQLGYNETVYDVQRK